MKISTMDTERRSVGHILRNESFKVVCNGSQVVRSGPGKTREKAETGLKGSIKVILLSQVITEMNILQHQSTKQNSFSLKLKYVQDCSTYGMLLLKHCYIFFTQLVMVCIAAEL